ncbi:MAG: amidase family protein [Rhodospirillaceae bacterium]
MKPQKAFRSSRRRLLQAAAWVVPAAALAPAALTSSAQAAADDLLELGVRAATDAIRKGDLKAEAYVSRLLAHYETQKHLNTVITMNEARVREEARAIDTARAKGAKLGALAGLPFMVKDQIDVAGYPTTSGNIALKNYVPKESARVVDIMVKQGAVVFAKANCADLVGQVRPGGVTSANPYFGFVRNPYDPAYSPGGSSGGNGAAIAARIVPAGIAQDGGGSVRLPACFNGIAGLRPSTHTPENFAKGTDRKRYSYHGAVLPTGMTGTFGPMARTVADVAFLDTIITGDAVPRLVLKDARIGIPRADYYQMEAMDPRVAKVTQDAFAKLRAAGAQLVEIDYAGLIALNADDRLGTAIAKPNTDLADWLGKHLPGVTAADVTRLRDSYPTTGAPPTKYFPADEAQKIMASAAATYAAAFRDNRIVAIAAPTVSILPPLVNSNGDTPGQKIMVNGRWIDEWDTIIYNLFWGARLGTPGLNVPSGLASGLPVGLQLQGLPGDDSRILALGLEVEQVLGPVAAPALRAA